MDIDRIIENVAKEAKEGAKNAQNGCAWSVGSEDMGERSEAKIDIENLTLKELLKTKPKTEEVKTEIYFRFKHDIEIFVSDFLERSQDPNADKGMVKCYLETWQSCATEIGYLYFNKNRYLRLNKNIENLAEGEGAKRYFDEQYFDNELLAIALELYEDFCNLYRKQFFIYDCCKFCGMNKDSMYRLSEMRTDILKRGHSAQESSYRTALASGRSNVTAMAILLNHDYDYTRTTQVIHTTEGQKIGAEHLPILEKTQDIVVERLTPLAEDHSENL